ncbi:hypothetical protein [Hydrocarboniphaga effusa]|uniref:hypothetical protein n=1 Tax=Hydrocarboniphaga effusa TaxID=243629 RepID=UPI0035B1A9EB
MKRLLLSTLLCFAAAELYFIVSSVTVGHGDISRLALIPFAGAMMTTGCVAAYLLGALLLRIWPRLPATPAFILSGGTIGLLIFLLCIWWHLSIESTVPMFSLMRYVVSGVCWGTLYAGCALLARHWVPPPEPAPGRLKPALRGS